MLGEDYFAVIQISDLSDIIETLAKTKKCRDTHTEWTPRQGILLRFYPKTGRRGFPLPTRHVPKKAGTLLALSGVVPRYIVPEQPD
jgi:hypothetical protein